MSAPRERFADELSVLRRQVHAGIIAGLEPDVSTGLELYGLLAEQTLTRLDRISTAAADGELSESRGSTVVQTAWLDDEFRGFVRLATRTWPDVAANHLLTLALRLARFSYRNGYAASFRQVLGLSELLWQRTAPLREEPEWGAFRYEFTLATRDLVVVPVASDARRERPSDRDLATAAAVHVSALARIAVAASDVDGLRRVARLLRSLAGGDYLDFESELVPSDLRLLSEAASLGVSAWIALRSRQGLHTADETETLLNAWALAPQPTLPSFLLAHRVDTEHTFGWHWWELLLRDEDYGAGVIAFDGYLTQAFADAVATGRASIDGETDVQRGDRFNVESLRSALADSPSAAARNAVEHLGEILARIRADQDDELISAALDAERVDEFAGALLAAWNGDQQVRSLWLSSARWSLQTADEQPGGRWLGMNRLESKVWFVATEVHADPSHLGREFGSALARGEAEYLLDSLTRATPPRQLPSDEIAGAALAGARELIAAGLSPIIVVFGNWEWVEAIVTADGSGRRGQAARTVEEAPLVLSGKVPVLLRYLGDKPEMVLIVDLESAVSVSYFRPPDSVFDASSHDHLAVRVYPIDRPRAEDLLSRNRTLAVEDGRVLEGEEALRHLQLRTQVEMFVHIDVEVTDPAAYRSFEASVLDDASPTSPPT